jgi:ABC-type Na+ efflux pump permease subunit
LSDYEAANATSYLSNAVAAPLILSTFSGFALGAAVLWGFQAIPAFMVYFVIFAKIVGFVAFGGYLYTIGTVLGFWTARGHVYIKPPCVWSNTMFLGYL